MDVCDRTMATFDQLKAISSRNLATLAQINTTTSQTLLLLKEALYKLTTMEDKLDAYLNRAMTDQAPTVALLLHLHPSNLTTQPSVLEHPEHASLPDAQQAFDEISQPIHAPFAPNPKPSTDLDHQVRPLALSSSARDFNDGKETPTPLSGTTLALIPIPDGLPALKLDPYAVQLDNKLGQRKFDGDYVHYGLLPTDGWVLDQACEILNELLVPYLSRSMNFRGHSAGSGVTVLLTIVVMMNLARLGNIDHCCFAIAPVRCMSVHQAVRYAHVINLVLQDFFFPWPITLLEDIFELCSRGMSDTLKSACASPWGYMLTSLAAGPQYSSSQIGAHLLTKMNDTAERYLGKSFSNVVIVVPACFHDSRRHEIEVAETIAGLDAECIINESMAVTLSFGLDHKEGLINVFDLGGDTFDTSILEISTDVFDVNGTNVDTFLGGVNFDNALIGCLVKGKKYGNTTLIRTVFSAVNLWLTSGYWNAAKIYIFQVLLFEILLLFWDSLQVFHLKRGKLKLLIATFSFLFHWIEFWEQRDSKLTQFNVNIVEDSSKDRKTFVVCIECDERYFSAYLHWPYEPAPHPSMGLSTFHWFKLVLYCRLLLGVLRLRFIVGNAVFRLHKQHDRYFLSPDSCMGKSQVATADKPFWECRNSAICKGFPRLKAAEFTWPLYFVDIQSAKFLLNMYGYAQVKNNRTVVGNEHQFDLVLCLVLHKHLDKHTQCVAAVLFNVAGDILVFRLNYRMLTLWSFDAGIVQLTFPFGHLHNVFQTTLLLYANAPSIVTCAEDFHARHAQIQESGHTDTISFGQNHGLVHKFNIARGRRHIFYNCEDKGLVQHSTLSIQTTTELFTCLSLHAKSSFMSFLCWAAFWDTSPFDFQSFEAWFGRSPPLISGGSMGKVGRSFANLNLEDKVLFEGGRNVTITNDPDESTQLSYSTRCFNPAPRHDRWPFVRNFLELSRGESFAGGLFAPVIYGDGMV